MDFKWDESHSVGNEVLDDQHRRLFDVLDMMNNDKGIYNRSYNAVYITYLEQFAKSHFRTERILMVDNCYEGIEQHVESHRQLLRKLSKIKAEIDDKDIEQRKKLIDFVLDWKVNHILTEDMKLKHLFGPKVIS